MPKDIQIGEHIIQQLLSRPNYSFIWLAYAHNIIKKAHF